jgi:hypothetical protein
MCNTHPTITNQNSNFNSKSGMLACILNDIFAKLGSITIRSVSETGRKGAGFGMVEETQRAGRIVFNKSHAEARGLRAEGRIIQLIIKLCEGGFNPTATNRIHPKQRARYRPKCRYESPSHWLGCVEDTLFVELFLKVPWRAAYPLHDGVPDGWELEWNFDSDNDGKNSWHTCRLEI